MRIALGIEYNGENYYGWQTQKGLLTIQETLQNALSKIANHPIEVFCAGRTDAGVHAKGQVVHFDTAAVRDIRAWVDGTNSQLPASISISWAKEVSASFHARFSALARAYCYVIYNNPVRSALSKGRATWYFPELNAEHMHEAAQSLLGEQDFTSFRSSQCESKTAMRRVDFIRIFRQNAFIMIEIQANAFLHHMVRNIVGSLMWVGTGKRPIGWIQELLKAQDRTKGAVTAAPHGLYLKTVNYPIRYNLPESHVFSLHF